RKNVATYSTFPRAFFGATSMSWMMALSGFFASSSPNARPATPSYVTFCSPNSQTCCPLTVEQIGVVERIWIFVTFASLADAQPNSAAAAAYAVRWTSFLTMLELPPESGASRHRADTARVRSRAARGQYATACNFRLFSHRR